MPAFVRTARFLVMATDSCRTQEWTERVTKLRAVKIAGVIRIPPVRPSYLLLVPHALGSGRLGARILAQHDL
jgi:hypothetical protein